MNNEINEIEELKFEVYMYKESIKMLKESLNDKAQIISEYESLIDREQEMNQRFRSALAEELRELQGIRHKLKSDEKRAADELARKHKIVMDMANQG